MTHPKLIVQYYTLFLDGHEVYTFRESTTDSAKIVASRAVTEAAVDKGRVALRKSDGRGCDTLSRNRADKIEAAAWYLERVAQWCSLPEFVTTARDDDDELVPVVSNNGLLCA